MKEKHQSSASLAFVRGIHRWPVNSPHIWPMTRKMSPFDDVIVYFSPIKDAYRLQDVAVVVSNQPFPSPAATPLQEPDYTLCGQYSGIPPASSITIFACAGAPLVARYVYVYIPTFNTPMTLCEVEVFAGGKSAFEMPRDFFAGFHRAFWMTFSGA